MSSGLASDEVAEDYKNSLEDLTLNSRYEISNLTVIAKENTEHAMAISRVLENHIRTAPPNRKLPALYVLDSVVKNVGTPYTLFLGRNLYQTFMNAYTLVDNQIRKKLDEMLKTWKEPVPGSMDTRPVFPVEITRSIENALIKAKTAAVQQQHQQAKAQQEILHRGRSTATPPMHWRNTPTPPQSSTPFALPYGAHASGVRSGNNSNHNNNNNNNNSNGVTPSYGNHKQYPQQYPPTPLSQPGPYQQPTQTPDTLDTLNNDIANLIDVARAEFATNLYDQGVQTRLKALLDLQSILRSQKLPPEQIKLIRDQVAQLSLSSKPTPIPAPPVIKAPEPPQPPAPQPNGQQLGASLQSLFSSNALAELLASTARAQQKPTPPPVQSAFSTPQPQLPFAQPQVAAAPVPPVATENPLVASLRAAGLLPPANVLSTATPPALPLNPAVFPMPPIAPPTIPLMGTPPTQSATPARAALAEIENDVEMTTASLKIPRPKLISTLYEAQPSQCTSCGRRFPTTEEGRNKKARHLDWHFRVNQRLVDVVKRGQNRSWYLDEMEWINYKENDEGLNDTNSNGTAAAGSAEATSAKSKKDLKNQYIAAPSDPALANVSCPICQERFETVWHDGAQEWVWMDAVRVGGRTYHASCFAEATKDGRGGTPARDATPEPVLGKRKAEDGDLNALRARIKKENIP
ncbi:hypothetical protein L228DRAFT_249485 [Xylona heveae TC161]|uniref:CID domain-containing protein n=1 Tax=Xylona heveae (strain CBS 132557 / TC161) TaxID=1328760 RepID=A0A165F8E2_XYLHT|nr:hypothetical protein L228DRAFT_249485 [Xylona heveae TC161]KZF20696.1 hypothetical protein L228DRAFT_249485 [Xylona heveae TC161]